MLDLANRTHYVVKQSSIGRDRIPTVDGPLAVPISKSSARFFNDWQERGTIPNVHHRIEHDVGATSRHQYVTVSVTPGSARMNASLQSLRGRPKSELFTGAKVRRQE